MPGCPQCGRQWPDGYQRCPEDGMVLVAYAASGGITDGATALADDFDEDLPAGSHAGDYQIERKIGEGGMGSVYAARHPLIGKRAAVKVIRRELSSSRDAVERFMLEAQSVNQIGHPNIVDVFGFGRLPDGRSFFVMELLQGEPLRERLQRALPLSEALEILEDIAKPLEAAHEAGVVHRDLKPDNVFLASVRGEKPKVKLLDFGLAKLTSQDMQRFDRTRTGVVMGTPLYLSPEQAKGQKVDVATDVYSLGAMAYEMFSGAVPFRADSAVEIMAMHISHAPVPLAQRAPQVPYEIHSLVMAMLDKNPAARPSTVQVRERIAACRTSSVSITVGTPTRYSQPTLAKGPRRARWIAIIAVLALLGGGVAVALLSLGGGTEHGAKRIDAPVAQVQQMPVAVPVADAAPPPADAAPVEVAQVAEPIAKAVEKKGKLSIAFAGPSHAQIVIDGKPYGRDAAGKVTIELPPGEHAVRVQANGYKPAETKVRITAGATRDVSLTLEQRKQGVNAVHDPFAD